MPVLIDRIEQLNINGLIWVDPVSKADALGFPGLIDSSKPEFGCRWISFFAPGVDLSDLDAACLLELRERLRPVVSALAVKGEFKMMLVSNSRYNDALLAVWRTMTATDGAYSSDPVLVHDIHSASRALGLPVEEAERARIWINSRIGRI